MDREIAAGYKQTEVGILPEDWETHTISNSMKLINGRAFKPSEWKDRGLPIIRIQNLNDSEATFNFCSSCVEEKHRIEQGDILFAWSGTKGTSFGARIWNGVTGVLNQHIFKVIPNQEKLTPEYTFLVLCKIQEHIEKQAHGFKASFVHVKKADLIGVHLPIPPTKTEQTAIATALSDVDALISGLEHTLAKKRLIKQGAMQALLTGKKRLAGFSGEWEVKKLGDVAFVATGNTPPTNDKSNYGDEYFFVSPADLGNEKYISYTEKKLSTKGFNISRKFPKDSVLFTCIGSTIGKSGIAPFELTSNQQINAVFPNEKFCSHFLFYALNKLSLKIKLSASEQAVPLINKTDFEAILIPFPSSIQEQTAIAKIIGDMDNEIEALEKRRTKTLAIKQGMMQELLTGKTRLI